MKESKLQKKIIDKYESEGWFVLRLIKTNKNGIPDLLCLRKGDKPTFIEVKAEKGKLSELQKYYLDELPKLGFDAYATTSVERHYCDKQIICSQQCYNCKRFINNLYDM